MSNLSVSQRLHDDLGRIIANSEPGERLPSEPALAQRLHVSRATLREAMRTFETQGFIRLRQGSGTYVSKRSAVFDTGLEVLESIETLAERIGLHVKLGESRLEHRLADDKERLALNLSNGQFVTVVTRVMLADERPVAYLIDILPENQISADELQTKFTGSVLDLLLQHGSPALVSSRTEISAVTATNQTARALGIQRGDVLLSFIAFLYDDLGQVVDLSYSYFLPGYFHFHVVRRVGQRESPSW
jgi:GntR family transcriptional regulator